MFCRYIPTADYLAEHLTTALTKKVPDLRDRGRHRNPAPRGTRDPRQRTLSDHDGPRLLIATDCLSEGINLQDGFTAVVHYDLAWNPTRHEQREGRVDRFGQRAPTVRTVTYYGEDNGIDGIVLAGPHHAATRTFSRSTGVSVPIPVDSTTVMKAIWESLLLRGNEADQLTLDFADATSESLADAVEVEWINAAEREKASRSRFRQAGLKPDAVAATLAEVRRSLGGPADAETFTRTRTVTDGRPNSPTPQTDSPRASTPCRPRCATSFHRPRTTGCTSTDSFPVPTGHSVLTRTDPTVEALSRYVLDAALDSRSRPDSAGPPAAPG